MSKQVTFDYSKAMAFISQEEIDIIRRKTVDALDVLM